MGSVLIVLSLSKVPEFFRYFTGLRDCARNDEIFQTTL